MMRRTIAVLLVILTTDCHGIIIRSVHMHHNNQTIMLLHDLHYAESHIIDQQINMIQHYAQQHPSTMILVEAPPKQDIHYIERINAFLASPHAQTPYNLFLETQKALGILHTEPLLSRLGRLNFDGTVHCYDHRALLFAISDAHAINSESIALDIPFNIGQLTAAIQQLEHKLIELEPVIAHTPASLIPDDYQACLATLRNYRANFSALSPDASIFTAPENDFFSWAINSPTLCNLLLEATFIKAVQTCESSSMIIVTGAYHAERLQMYFEKNGFSIDHDTGITCNKKIMYQSYGRILKTIIPTRNNISDALHTIATAIAPLKKLTF